MNDNYFIISVYSIIFAQLSITCTIACYLHVTPSLLHSLMYSPWYLLLLLCLSLSSIVGLYLFSLSNWKRICMFACFTMSMSTIVGIFICTCVAFGYTEVILFAVCATMTTFVSLSILVCCCDNRNNILLVPEQLLFTALILLLIWNVVSSVHTSIYSMLGIFVFIGYIIVDTWRIVQVKPSATRDPLLAAIDLYLDVVNLFVFIVEYYIGDTE